VEGRIERHHRNLDAFGQYRNTGQDVDRLATGRLERTISSPKARFIQWNAVLKSDGARSPRLGSVKVPFLQQNFRPEVTNVDLLPSGVLLQKTPLNTGNNFNPNDPATIRANARAGQPRIAPLPPRRIPQRGSQSFQWTATDKNQDVLTYDVYYRAENERTWKVLKRDLEDAFYTINSDTLPDGTYVVRVVASDQTSNPPDLVLRGEMESRPFVIDNTPPAVTMTLERVENRRARVAIEAADQTSTLTQAEVAVDTGEWRPVFPKGRHHRFEVRVFQFCLWGSHAWRARCCFSCLRPKRQCRNGQTRSEDSVTRGRRAKRNAITPAL
jgi:hypothetical protein